MSRPNAGMDAISADQYVGRDGGTVFERRDHAITGASGLDESSPALDDDATTRRLLGEACAQARPLHGERRRPIRERFADRDVAEQAAGAPA